MSTEKKPRQPRNPESITKGALALPLAERAALRDALSKSVQEEVALLQKQAEQASKLVG